MKKITLITLMLWAFAPKAASQCSEPVSLPYHEDFDTAVLPDLPECTFSYRQTFVGNEWEAAAAPNNSFTGNTARYSTITDVGWSMMCNYILRPMQLENGKAYKISYKYAHDNNDDAIDFLRVILSHNTSEQSNIEIAVHEGISGTEIVNYSSDLFTVPATGTYYLHFDIESSGNQGILYLDDIKIEDMGIMSARDNSLTTLACYPNPVKNVVTITNSMPLDKLELYTVTGQLLLAQPLNEQTTTIALEDLPTGMYLLKAESGAASKTIQLIKQ